MLKFENELAEVLNKNSKETRSDTPDFILAEFLSACLDAWNVASNKRERWYGMEAESEKDLEEK